MSNARYLIGDVTQRLTEVPDDSIDLVVTSPPFLALRSYLPDDHPDKYAEIGSEPDPASFLDTMLGLTAEWGRVLAPHGTICVELGDTYSGSGGAGGDYGPGGLRDGQERFDGSASRTYGTGAAPRPARHPGPGWPLAKSLTGIPTLYTWSLAYGRNLLTGQPSPAGQWRIRNVIVWARPNPPVGALGDKFRPATSYITVATRSAKRWFDLDAVRTEGSPNTHARTAAGVDSRPTSGKKADNPANNFGSMREVETTGAPPLDWCQELADDPDGDWLWRLNTQPYKGKTSTVRRVPCGPGDGGVRTVSPDCPMHGDLTDQTPKAPDGGHGAERQAAKRHTRRTGAHPAGEQLPGFEPTDESHARSDSFPRQMTAMTDHGCSAVATPHSSPSHRTDRAPATTPPDTPSVRTVPHTERTPASPESSALNASTSESSISSGDSDASHEPRTEIGTSRTPDSVPPCLCTFHREEYESTSHYATFPSALPARLIEAMCPRDVCTGCGEPRRRVVETSYKAHGARKDENKGVRGGAGASGEHAQHMAHGRADKNVTTLGWSECDCPDEAETMADPGYSKYRRGLVLDPFAGSGTTLAAATGAGRDAIGIDLDQRNADLARDRVGMFLQVEP